MPTIPLRAVAVLVLATSFYAPGLLGDEPAAPRRVIIVSLDGLRPDAIRRAGYPAPGVDPPPATAATPTLAALVELGVWAKAARTIMPSITLPSHTSMLTGRVPAKHGVILWNDYAPERGQIKSTTILELAAKAGRRTAMFAGKEKFWHLSRGTDYHYLRGDPEALADAVIAYLAEHEVDLLFLHFAEPDSTGHREGWLSEAQLTMIGRVDAALGRVKASVDALPWGPSAVWIVTADHGGHDRTHGTWAAVDMSIPWICVGPGIRKGLQLERELTTYDTAATALAILGLGCPEGMDGKAVTEAFEPAPIAAEPLKTPELPAK